MNERRTTAPLALAAAGLATLWAPVFGASTAWAQPNPAQVDAIRRACRSDYMRVCASVPTGGEASLRCLEQHSADLTTACGQAVAAVSTDATAPDALPVEAPSPKELPTLAAYDPV